MKDQKRKSWLGAAFGLLSILAGLAGGYLGAGQMIVGYVSTIDWTEVSAEIHELELVSNNGNTPTYTVTSSYSYQVDGKTYHNNRVGLGSGSDNIGEYWQQLYQSLIKSRSINETSALVNPNNPNEAVLDRTLRWESIVFSIAMITIFCGLGAFITWNSLRYRPIREERLTHQHRNGIESDQKNNSLLLGIFGFLFLFVGIGSSLLILPQAIKDGEYLALLVLVFAIVGIAVLLHAFNIWRAFKKFGPTPLFLDPIMPAIGGQLGGSFTINTQALKFQSTISADSLTKARLSCLRIKRSRNNSSRTVEWHDEVPVYLQQTAKGHRALFVFDIPEDCKPTESLDVSTSIRWQLDIQGNTSIGTFTRTWQVEVEAKGSFEKSTLPIPARFLQTSQQIMSEQARLSAIDQIRVSEDHNFINIHSRAGRHFIRALLGMLFGIVFAGVGVFTILDNWWPGYLFVLIGGYILLACIFSLGKAVEVKICKQHNILYTRESWMGIVYARKQADVVDAGQFKTKKTSSSQSGSKMVEFYVLDFKTGFKTQSKTVRIADSIKGKKAAEALRDTITERLFEQQHPSKAA